MCLCGFSTAILALLVIVGCGGKKQQAGGKALKREARELLKQAPQTVQVQVQGGQFQVEDSRGRPVMTARIPNAKAELQPSDPSHGPVTIYAAEWTLYKEGQPSLWLKAPVATWQNGLLTAPRGAHSGSVDGRITLNGKTAIWTARTDLLMVSTAGCQLRDPGRPALLAQGPKATWQSGLLTLPAGGTAHAVDGSSALRADQIRWRARTHSLEATGRVRMTQGRLAGAAQRLTGDTALRQFRLTGGRPRVTIYNQPAPPITAMLGGDGGSPRWISSMPRFSSSVSSAFAGSAGVLVALASAAPPAAARPQVSLSSGVTIEADQISGVAPTVVHATGDVVLTSPRGVLRADRVDATQSPRRSPKEAPVQEAQATGNVRLTSQPKPEESMRATGAAGTYWPGTHKATLTGEVTVTMASPQLQGPAVLTGARAEIDLAQRTAVVVRTPSAPVTLRLQPKEAAGGSSSVASGPLQLAADRMMVENAANRVTATGAPVLTSDQGTVHAEKIWFDLDPKARDVKAVHAAGAVRIDAQDATRGSFHATSQEALLNRAEDTVVLTGKAEGSHLSPGQSVPETFKGEQLTYNLKTGEFELGASGEARAKVTLPPKPKPAGSR